MWLEEVEKMTKKDLRALINHSFELAEEPGRERGPLYEKAAFYMRELEHRRDSWVSIRDFILEIIVIALIGVEIGLAIKQGTDEDKLMDKQNGILRNMQTSSSATAETLKTLVATMGTMNSSASATADTLKSLRSTTVAMNNDVHGQLILLYDPSLHLVYDTGSKKITLSNNGRTNIKLDGTKYEITPAEMFAKPFLLAPGAAYTWSINPIYQDLFSKVAKGMMLERSFDLYIRNELDKKYLVHSRLVGIYEGDTFTIHTQVQSIDATDWTIPTTP